MPSTLVDSASPGRNVVDSLFSASAYLPGRFRPRETATTSNQRPATTHFARRPAGRVRSLAIEGGGAGSIGAAEARRAGSRPNALREQRRELVRLGDRPPAREALAHVG